MSTGRIVKDTLKLSRYEFTIEGGPDNFLLGVVETRTGRLDECPAELDRAEVAALSLWLAGCLGQSALIHAEADTG